MGDAMQAAEAFAFRKLVAHLQMRTDVQNIDVMCLTGFCRNCLSKWLHAGAVTHGVPLSYDDACERVYAMPYQQYKKTHQCKATEEQLRRFEETKALHAKHVPPTPPAQQPTAAAAPPPPPAAPPSGGLLSDVCCEPIAPMPQPTAALLPPPPAHEVDVRLGVLTVSDRASAGVYADASGPEVRACMQEYAAGGGAGCWRLDVRCTAVVADEAEAIRGKLLEWSEADGAARCNLILTTGAR